MFGTARRNYDVCVLPEHPADTEKMSEEELASLVTRDQMIGVARGTSPGQGDRQ